MTTVEPLSTPSTRRAVLISLGGATLALCVGCSAAGNPPGGQTTGGTTGGQTASGGGQATSGGTTGSGSGTATTVAAADIPVGSGRIVGEFVVTQPTEGTFEAFSYLCTHQNLPVQEVTDSAIVCGRHGSTFSLADGSVITGPATTSLAAATVTRDGDTLSIG